MIFVVGLVIVAVACAIIVAFAIELLICIALALVLSAGAGIVAGMVAQQSAHDGTVVGIGIALLAFLPALIMASRRRLARLRARLDAAREPASGAPQRVLEPFEAAWATARGLAPRNALEGAQEASMRLRELVDRHGSFDPELVDYAVTLRRHVPALVSETEELLATADRVDRRAAVAALVEDLVRLGQGASDLLAQQGFTARERLAVRRARLFGAGRAV